MDAAFQALDFPGLDWGGYSREEVFDLLTEAALDSLDGTGADFAAQAPVRVTPLPADFAADLPDSPVPPPDPAAFFAIAERDGAAAALAAWEEAQFYSPDQPRDDRGRWSSGAGGGDSGDADPFRGGMTHAARSEARTTSAQHVRDFVARGGPATGEEVAALGNHLARLTVAQLHALRAEHGLPAAGAWRMRRPDLVNTLAGRFRDHRAALPTRAARELAAAAAGGAFEGSRYTPGDSTHAVKHGRTGFTVSAHPDGRFHVWDTGLAHQGAHDTAAAAVAHAANPPAKPSPDYRPRTADVETAARQGAVADAAARRADPQAAARAAGQKLEALYEGAKPLIQAADKVIGNAGRERVRQAFASTRSVVESSRRAATAPEHGDAARRHRQAANDHGAAVEFMRAREDISHPAVGAAVGRHEETAAAHREAREHHLALAEPDAVARERRLETASPLPSTYGGAGPAAPAAGGGAGPKAEGPTREQVAARMRAQAATRRSHGRRRADFADEGGGHWVTIGAREGDDGGKTGGTPVYIVDGRITKGAPSLTGKRIDALDKPAEKGGPKSQAKEAAAYQRARFAKEGRKAGVHPEDLHQLAAEMKAHDHAFKADRTAILQHARRISKGLGSDLSTLKARASKGLDSDAVRHLDDVAQSVASSYPEHFAGHDPEQRLFEMLSEGNPTPISEHEAYEHALDHLSTHGPFRLHESRRRHETADEEVPFALPALRPIRFVPFVQPAEAARA